MSIQIDRRDIEDLMVTALRQFQHNDCSGFVAGYDMEETITVIVQLFEKQDQATHRERQKNDLTDDRILEIFRNTFPNGPFLFTDDTLKFARAIEKAVG